MKKITIEDDLYNQKVSCELNSDCTIEDITDCLKGMLVSMGFSYKTVKEYFL